MKTSSAPWFAVVVMLGLGCDAAPSADERSRGAADASASPRLLGPEEPRSTLPFSAAIGARIGSDSVLLLDMEWKRVVVYDVAAAAAVDSFGSEGSGPDQFILPVAAAVVDGGGYVVADGRQMRLSWWSAEGALERTAPLPHWPLKIWPHGDSLLAVWLPFSPGQGPHFGVWSPGSPEPARQQALFELVPVLTEAPAREMPSPFVGVARCPDGSVIVGNSRNFTLARISTGGRVLGSFGRPDQAPIYLTDDEARELQQRMRRLTSIAPSGMAADIPTIESLQRGPRPYFRPKLAGDERGRIWIPTNRPAADSSEIDVFSCSGELLGTVTLRDEVQELSVREDRLVALVKRKGAQYFDQQGIDVYDVAHVFD